MGYYTYFSLSLIGDKEDIDEVTQAALSLDSDDDSLCYNEGIKELVTTGGIDAKWYSFENDFIPFARKFPKVLFIVDGSGEETDDIWQWRIKGELDEYHQVEMPPFNTSELLTETEKNKI